MRFRCLLATIAGVFVCWQQGLLAQELEPRQQQFKKALAAIRAGNTKAGFDYAAGLETYPLYQYLRYEYLRPRLHTVKAEEVRQFLVAYDGSVLAERLRTEWLRWLGRAGFWRLLVEDYRPQDDVGLQCLFLKARLQIGESDGVARDAIPLWLVGKSQPDACDPAFALLYQSRLLTDDLVWQRIELAMRAGEIALAQFLAGKLPVTADRVLVARWLEVHRNPRAGLQHRDLKLDTPRVRAIIAQGIVRLARADVDAALASWSERQPQFAFTEVERQTLDRDLAVVAASRDDPRALELLAHLNADAIDNRVDDLRLRLAVSGQDWQWIVNNSGYIDPDGNNALAWQYWRSRAMERTGRTEVAHAGFVELAKQRDYYGFLAADRIDAPYAMINLPTPLGETERAAIASIPGIVRAHELYRLGYDYEARREWHFEVARVTPREQAMLAVLAHEWGWYDRAIITMGYTRQYDDLEVRFPIVHRDLIAQYAAKRGIDEALMYSIIRAESAFMVDARSEAGAVGLMQLLPQTARETAQRIGFAYQNATQLMQAQTNITLGSAYLQQMLARFNGSFPMAAAAYNAGPHRVKTWLPPSGCMPADVWIESLPFSETRRYVKQTLFYAAVYESRLNHDVTPLATRLAAIPLRTGAPAC